MRLSISIMIIVLLALSLSGCLEQPVENGDIVEVNYIGFLENGAVFDTSYASVAYNNSIPKFEDFEIRDEYTPLGFTVGQKNMIAGFNIAVIGMKRGEIKTFNVSSEDGFGKYDPELIRAIPRTLTIPSTRTENRTIEVPAEQFEEIFGEKAVLNKSLKLPGTNVNATIVNVSSTTVFLENELKEGDILESEELPFNETVVSLNQTTITLALNLVQNQTIQVQGMPWSSTVIAVNNTTITLWYNSIPSARVQIGLGWPLVSFNESMLILDYNHPLAGKNLTFKVELVNLTKPQK